MKGGSPTKGDKSKIVWEVVEQQFEALVSVLLHRWALAQLYHYQRLKFQKTIEIHNFKMS